MTANIFVVYPSTFLSLPLLVSHSQQGMGGHSEDLSFFSFSSAKSHENCLHYKVAPVINDKKTSKPLVVTGALHAIQWI